MKIGIDIGGSHIACGIVEKNGNLIAKETRDIDINEIKEEKRTENLIIEKNLFFKTILSSILEITNGLNNLANINLTSKIKEIIGISTISFGGLSIHTQIKAILEETEIKYKCFFKGRIMHTIISIILIIIF